ncbi:MAG: Ferrochelatase [Pseudomonadota bacterium]|jgi:ferrochelatase
MQKHGVLLINLGTPSAPTFFSVASYLNSFLTDDKVIDLPYFLRQCLVKGIIVPFRTRNTLKAYRSIWTATGSPLRTHMQSLRKALQLALDNNGESALVALGMRYGEPSIPQGIAMLREAGCTYLHILPLYPQYAAATTGSALAVVLDTLKQQEPILPFKVYSPFYQASGFIEAFALRIREHTEKNREMTRGAFTVFSYHGLPERQVRNMGCAHLSQCQQKTHCIKVKEEKADPLLTCYRAQCFLTTNALVKALNLNPMQTATAFQSRVGRIPWIQPYTDKLLQALIAKKIKRVVIVCPSFVVDCLETLEEIEIRAKEAWEALGGEYLSMVPSLNAHPTWVNTLMDWIIDNNQSK